MGECKHPLKSLSPPGVVALIRRPRSQSLQGLGASLHPQVPPPPRCHQKLCLGSPVLGLPSENQRCPVTPPHTESPGGPGGNHLFPQRENLCLLPGRAWAMCFLCKRLKPEKKASRFRSLQLSPQNGFVQSACSTLKDAGRWLYRIDRVKSSACLGAQQASVSGARSCLKGAEGKLRHRTCTQSPRAGRGQQDLLYRGFCNTDDPGWRVHRFLATPAAPHSSLAYSGLHRDVSSLGSLQNNTLVTHCPGSHQCAWGQHCQTQTHGAGGSAGGLVSPILNWTLCAVTGDSMKAPGAQGCAQTMAKHTRRLSAQRTAWLHSSPLPSTVPCFQRPTLGGLTHHIQCEGALGPTSKKSRPVANLRLCNPTQIHMWLRAPRNSHAPPTLLRAAAPLRARRGRGRDRAEWAWSCG